MKYDELTEQEIDAMIERAQAHYRKEIRPHVYPQQKGRMVVIDLESLDYEIADRDIDATLRLRERRPGCLNFGIRIGYKAAYHFGARRTPDEER